MGKGSKRRPCSVSPEEEKIRWDLYQGEITEEVFNEKLKEIRDKNNGRKT